VENLETPEQTETVLNCAIPVNFKQMKTFPETLKMVMSFWGNLYWRAES